MTEPLLEPPAEERVRRRPDPRLPAYLLAGFGTLVLAVAIGNSGLAALGAPFVVLATWGLVRREPGRPRARIRIDETQVVEGDEITGEVTLDWDGVAEVDAVLTAWRGVVPIDPHPVPGWSPAARRGPVRLPLRLSAESWGHHELGHLWVRMRAPSGLIEQEVKVAVAPTVKVLPSPLKLDRLLTPREPRAVAGRHLSRSRGPGTDFADLRPYQPGDRLRDISWATSARLGEPWVTVHHPERTGTVVVLLDTFFGDDHETGEALARAARAAWALASAHLSAQDRVGLLARGRTAAWVPPRGGRRARWMIVEQLLAVGGAAEDPWRRRRGRRVVVPADALVVGVTALRSRAFAHELLHHRRNGHATAALVIDTSDLLPPDDDATSAVARRLWHARREVERVRLEKGGVATVLVPPGGAMAGAVTALRRRVGAGIGRAVGAMR